MSGFDASVIDARLEQQGWPRFVPLGAAAIVATNLVAAVIQRREFWQPGVAFGYTLAGASLAAAVAFLPFLLDSVAILIKRPLGLPLVLFPVPVALGVGFLVFHPANTDFAPFVLVFAAAEIATRAANQRLLSLWGWALGIAVMVAADVLGRFDGTFIWVIGITFGWFGGFMVGQLDARKQELEEAQAGLTEKAATDERARIAREVHDVIAHSLSVTMLHVSAARMALERDRTSDALDALKEAETQGRNSLNEVRRTVGLLGPEESATAAPMPGVVDLPKLVADFRAAGLDATMRISADLDDLPATAGLNIYRIVQESLTNAVKHAPGAPVRVELAVNDTQIRLRVHNDAANGGPTGNNSGTGMGLRGMAERAAVLGGELKTDDTDGWTVTVVAPRPVA
jgi:signal transduction histidine kinase